MPFVDVPGLGQVEFPDGTTNAVMEKAISQRMAQKHGEMALEGTSAFERGAIGAGKALTDLWQGAKQLVGKTNESDVQAKRDADTAIMNTTAGRVGEFSGNLAASVPTMVIPGVNTYRGAGLLGSAMGLLQPTAEKESKWGNVGIGAAGGMLGQGVGNALGRIVKPVQSSLPASEQKILSAAQANGIPVTAGQATGSRPLQIAESVMENLPFTSGPQLALRDAQAKAFNQAVLSKAGISADEATPAFLGSQKTALGGQFNTIAGRNTIDFNQGSVLTDLSKIASDGSRRLSNPEPLKNTIDDILADAANGVMEGTKYQGWRETLGRLASGNGSEAHYFSQVKKALDKAFSAQVPAADAEAWKQTSREYANLKTIMDAMGGAGAATKSGNIPAAQLEGALTRSIGREGKALGRGDLNELVGVGRKFVSDNIPNSGTAQRQLVQGLLTGGGGAVLGAGGAAATGNDWKQGALTGAGVTAAGLALPRVIQSLMNSPAGQAYLTQGLMTLGPKELALLNAAGRGTGAGLLGYAGQQ